VQREAASSSESDVRDALVVGGGFAGLSAALYLARARRTVTVVDSGHSLARWEPRVQNYLGIVDGIAGTELLERSRQHASKFGAKIIQDEINDVRREDDLFFAMGKEQTYRARRLLLATGLLHIPPDIPGVKECLGHSMFFCKDCDGLRVEGKRIALIGTTNEAAEYALGMLTFSSDLFIATNAKPIVWDEQHADWLREYQIPVYTERIVEVRHEGCFVRTLQCEGGREIDVDAIFTSRGDVYHNALARKLDAKIDPQGEIVIDLDQRTSIPGLYAAGCVTPANCQMIIAAGQGATAAQAINRDLFEQSLREHALRRYSRRPAG
jgi:thioredoxin reductase (NADPH)